MMDMDVVDVGQPVRIQRLIDRLADEFGRRPAHQRASWVVYVLENLESQSGSGFDETLRQVGDSISMRLSSGAW